MTLLSLPRRQRPLALLAGVLLALSALAFAGLPALERHRLADRLSALGPVRSLHTEGHSGLGLLRGHPTALDVHLASLHPAAVRARSGKLAEIPDVLLRADAVDAAPVAVRDVVIAKHGCALRASARTEPGAGGGPTLVARDGRPALRVALPPALLEGGGTVRTVDVPLVAHDGGIYGDTSALPVGGGAQRRVFSTPEVVIDDLTAQARGTGVAVRAAAHLAESASRG